MVEVRSVLPVQATLGEGPVWVERDQALWFVDIKGHKVHRFHPASGDHKSYDAPCQVGWVLPADDGSFLAGLQQGLARFDPLDGRFDVIATPEAAIPGNRLNDATVDPAGRVWFGSMDDGEEAISGRLYCFDRCQVREAEVPPVCITNGPAVSPDGRILYHTDTLGRVIYKVGINDDGSLGAASVFATIDEADGWPDGSVCDSEGCVWIGLWGGWRARRYAPTGEILTEVRLPASNITKIAFGGADLCTIYATSARKGLDAAALDGQPLAGNIFAFDVEVPGLPGNLVRLN